MTDLTEQARANVAAGAESGAGTDVCKGCEGPKEPTRVNSNRCRTCERAGQLRTEREKASPRVTLKTQVTRDQYEQADAAAKALGTSIAAVMRDALIELIGASPSTPVQEPLVNVDLWQEVVRWFKDRPDQHRAYIKNGGDPTDPAQCIEYARQRGFTPATPA